MIRLHKLKQNKTFDILVLMYHFYSIWPHTVAHTIFNLTYIVDVRVISKTYGLKVYLEHEQWHPQHYYQSREKKNVQFWLRFLYHKYNDNSNSFNLLGVIQNRCFTSSQITMPSQGLCMPWKITTLFNSALLCLTVQWQSFILCKILTYCIALHETFLHCIFVDILRKQT